MPQSLGQRANELSRQLFGRPVGQVVPRGGPIRVQPKHNQPLAREALPHFWHPQRMGVEQAPRTIADRLASVHRDLRLVRPPAGAPVPVRCWILWTKKAEITYPLCPGWQLLMLWEMGGRPLPLDERLFAAIYHFDRRSLGVDAVQYFDRVIAERNRAREKREQAYKNDLHDEGEEFRQSLQINNLGSGSKFALHHDGTVVPSQGEQNWLKERRRRVLPSKLLRDERDR